MGRTYGDKTETLTPAKIPARALNSIGVLTRSFAEIDDLVGFYMLRLTGLREGMLAILINRMPISEKLKRAEDLAKVHGPDFVKAHKVIFDGVFQEILQCRNIVAHGVLLGRTKTNRFAFLTASQLDPMDSKITREVVSYSARDLSMYAADAHALVSHIEHALKLSTLRKRCLPLSLLPHRRSQNRLSASGGPLPQQPSSPPRLSKAQRRAQMVALARERAGK